MLKAKDFRAEARKALKGKYVQAIIAGLIAGILGGNIAYKGYTGSSAGGAAEESLSSFSFEEIILAAIILVVIAALVILVGSIVGLGYAKFNLALYENDKVDFKTIFSERSRYKDCFKLYLLQFIYITIGSILFVIPGVIATYAYMLGAYIMVDHPEMSAKEVMAESRKMMKGNKWRLFCLSFSFIGWDILALLTAGIGHLFLCPYVEAAVAAFYRELKEQK